MGEVITLRNGVKMPQVQLGTFRTRGDDVYTSVAAALATGYRAIDTAAVYRNHANIADTLAAEMPRHQLTRADIFLTSKLAPRDQGAEACRRAIVKVLEELKTDYLDLFLIHWPGVQKLAVDDPQNAILRYLLFMCSYI